jgi:excisionase family DNA binding protein
VARSGVDATLPARLLTVDELAVFLAVSVAWVRKGVLERTLPYTKIGRNVRFTPQQVAQILEDGQRPPVRHEPVRRSRGSARTRL